MGWFGGMPLGFDFLLPWGGDAVRQRGGSPACARPPSVALRHLPPHSGGRKFFRAALGGLIFSPWGDAVGFNFLPPLGGRCRRQRGGAAAPMGVSTALQGARGPPLSRCDISPRFAGGENSSARRGGLNFFSLGEMPFGSDFLPPLGGRCRRQRGGVRRSADGCVYRPSGCARPPLSRCDISPRKRGEKILFRAAWGGLNFLPWGDAVGFNFLPPKGGRKFSSARRFSFRESLRPRLVGWVGR